MTIQVVSLAERPELADRIGELEGESFPEYINAEPTWEACFPKILDVLAHLQVFLVEEETDELLALICNSAFKWDGDTATLPGYNDMLRTTLLENEQDITPNVLCGIMGIIPEKHQRKGVSKKLYQVMLQLTERYNFKYVLSPVRPTLKQRYPNFTTEEYLSWKTADGRAFDPWIRSNESMAPKFLSIAHNSINISADIDQWQRWCDMEFPASGEYVIPDGHKLLKVDRENDVAFYGEDHVWYSYPVK